MTYKLRISNDLVDLIREIHPELKRKLKTALDTIRSNPFCGKKLRHELDGYRSYRVSRFRIIYRTAKLNELEVVAIGPRKSIYQETYRLLQRQEGEDKKKKS